MGVAWIMLELGQLDYPATFSPMCQSIGYRAGWSRAEVDPLTQRCTMQVILSLAGITNLPMRRGVVRRGGGMLERSVRWRGNA